MRHGAEPDEALAVKLMLKWPNLYYSTSAFAPKHYPQAIIDYANTRGNDKILYGGYFPFGLELNRIMEELEDEDTYRRELLARMFGGKLTPRQFGVLMRMSADELDKLVKDLSLIHI